MNFVVFCTFHHISIQKLLNSNAKHIKALKQTGANIYIYIYFFILRFFVKYIIYVQLAEILHNIQL